MSTPPHAHAPPAREPAPQAKFAPSAAESRLGSHQGGESYDAADVLTFRDGKLAKFQSTSDTAALERVFGTE